MKKIIIILVALVLVFSLAACNNKNDKGNNGETPTSAPENIEKSEISAAQAQELVAKAVKYIEENPYLVCRTEQELSLAGSPVKKTVEIELSGKNVKCDYDFNSSIKYVQTIVDGMCYTHSESVGDTKTKYSIADANINGEIENMFVDALTALNYIENMSGNYTFAKKSDGTSAIYIKTTETEGDITTTVEILVTFDNSGRFASVGYASSSENKATEEKNYVDSTSSFEYKDSSFKVEAPADSDNYKDPSSRG